MPDTSQFKISSKQLVFIILGNTVATGMLSLPRVASADARQDAWLAVIGGAVAPLLVLLLVQRLFSKFPEYNLVDISCLLFGRIMGIVLVGFVVLYFLVFQAVVLSNLTEVTMTFILPQTPHGMIMIVSVLAMIFVASQGAQVVARINEIFLYQFLLVIVLWIIPAFSSDFTNLLPIGGTGWEGISKGALNTSFSYSGIEILLLIYPMVTKSKEVIKAGLTAVGITLTFYLILTLSCLLVFGIDMLTTINIWPGLTVLKVLDIPVIGRLEVFFLLLWMGFSIRPVFTSHMAVSYALTGLWGGKLTHAYSYLILGLGVVMIGFALIPINIEEVSLLNDYVGKAFWVVGVGYPLLYLGTAAFREKVSLN